MNTVTINMHVGPHDGRYVMYIDNEPFGMQVTGHDVEQNARVLIAQMIKMLDATGKPGHRLTERSMPAIAPSSLDPDGDMPDYSDPGWCDVCKRYSDTERCETCHRRVYPERPVKREGYSRDKGETLVQDG